MKKKNWTLDKYKKEMEWAAQYLTETKDYHYENWREHMAVYRPVDKKSDARILALITMLWTRAREAQDD